MDRREIKPGRAAEGDVRVPGSKSVTNRHLNLALLARQAAVIEEPLIAADTRAFIDALRQLGMQVSESPRELEIGAGSRVDQAKIDCAASGTMLRFLVGSLTVLPGVWTLDGIARLRERPVGQLIDALRALGARIECLRQEGFAPVRVFGGGLRGGRVELDAGSSSQFLSSLLMAGLRAEARIEIAARDLVSAPYVEITRRVIRDWGGQTEVARDGALVVEPGRLQGARFRVEGDHSSACYLAAGAAVLGGSVVLRGVSEGSPQGDRRFFSILASMGVSVEWQAETVRVTGGSPLEALECDMSDMPDQVPTLAALAPFAKGTTRILNVPHLRLKESDRLAAVAAGLRSAGARVEELDDGLAIEGVWHAAAPPTSRALIGTLGDHRIAMSFAVLGLGRPGVEIEAPGVVEKSYPGFWYDFSSCFESG